MFKILFNRISPLVRVLEIVGVVNSYILLNIHLREMSLFTILFFFLLASYLFVRLCDLIPWYSKDQTPDGIDPKRVGIRVHFQKALVPTSYILAITSSVCLLGPQWLTFTIVILACLCMLIVAPVNGILIWFHLKDKEELPVNYFSLGKYELPPH